ncbi:MAG TPA: hypothetical protein VH575_36825 [Gemmataceae bacterium]|jgi:hypothetical protein
MMTEAFPVEMRLVADALRHVREQIAFLVHTGDERVAGQDETQTILDDAIAVAAALERLAERLIATM